MVATSTGFLSVGGTYDGTHDMTDIYEFVCEGSEPEKPCADGVWNSLTPITLSPARRGKVAWLIPKEYLQCSEISTKL